MANTNAISQYRTHKMRL